MNPFVLLFDFRGRINRAKFWLAHLIYVVFLIAVIGIASTVFSSIDTVFGAALVACIPLAVSGMAVGIKRLHDRNKSAWWLAVFAVPWVLPFVGAALDGFVTPAGDMAFVFLQYVGLAIMIWALVELGCLRGTIGANQYGGDPLAPQPAAPRTLR
jgi:uncharacterized membrane protein YhaH (DUF805 family)